MMKSAPLGAAVSLTAGAGGGGGGGASVGVSLGVTEGVAVLARDDEGRVAELPATRDTAVMTATDAPAPDTPSTQGRALNAAQMRLIHAPITVRLPGEPVTTVGRR